MSSLKSFVKKNIPYRIFLIVIIYSYYNISLLFKINKKYRFFSKKKFSRLFDKGYMFCSYANKNKTFSSDEFNEFSKRMLSFTKKQKNLKRVIYNSNEVLNEKLLKILLEKSIIKEICDNYFKFKYFLGCAEVWWGRPNYLSSGYSYFHRDRQHLNSLHFDINLIDMYEGSGAVEVINKSLSKKVKRYWGGEMIKNPESLYDFFSKKTLKENIEIGYGKKGSIFCYDSMTNLHRGGLCKKSERLILHICFYEDVYWRKEKFPLKLNMC